MGGERPPKRLLERAPSELLAAPPAVAGADAEAGSAGRALACGLFAAGSGAAVHALAATWLLWTGGLLVVAATLGILIGLAVAVGGGGTLAPAARRSLAAGLAVAALLVAIAVNWALSGMYLGPLDYLGEVYGLLVPLQLVLAAVGGLAGSR
jgi:hypothetical protein